MHTAGYGSDDRACSRLRRLGVMLAGLALTIGAPSQSA